VKGYPFEVALPDGLPVTGVVLADQVKSLDWKARQCARLCAIPEQLVVQVLRRLNTLLSERAER
jgi:mRNA interferase MazF